MVCFIDWLSIEKEVVGGGLPKVGKDVLVASDLETGEFIYETVRGFQHEGSYETSVHVRCDGNMIRIDGNPSAFGRRENLFGFETVEQCIMVYNRILTSLNLPRLGYFEQGMKDHGRTVRGDRVIDGDIIIKRIDITENLETNGVNRALRSLSGCHHRGEPGLMYPNGRTVAWSSGSRRLYVKYYDKGFMLENQKKRLDLRINALPANSEKLINLTGWAYRVEEVKELCEEKQMIRHETSLKGQQLQDMGLRFVGDWQDKGLAEVIKPWAFHRQNVVTENVSDQSEMIERLMVLADCSRDQARRAVVYLEVWKAGTDLHYREKVLSRNTYYRIRRLLLLLGVDIASRCDITRLPIRVETVTISSCERPGWYDRDLKVA